MECVSTPLYVWSRDKKLGLPNFPALESRATLWDRRRQRRRHYDLLRLHQTVFLFALDFAHRSTISLIYDIENTPQFSRKLRVYLLRA